jgi:hypothetical protein
MEQASRLGLSLSYDIITRNRSTVKGETKEGECCKVYCTIAPFKPD